MAKPEVRAEAPPAKSAILVHCALHICTTKNTNAVNPDLILLFILLFVLNSFCGLKFGRIV